VAFNVKAKNNKGKGQSLLKRMTSKLKDTKLNDNNKEQTDKKTKKLYCKHCKAQGHLANDCDKWDEDPCPHCGRFNHKAKDCWHKDKPKQDKGKGKGSPRKRARNEETNIADDDLQLSSIMIETADKVAPGGITFDSSEQGQHFNFKNHDVTNFNGIDERTLYYDWLADSATTSHIVNWRDIFKTYEPVKNTPITGVGGLRAQAMGRSNVNVYMTINSETFTIHLCDILYVPRNRNNLFSLGRWLAKGGDFSGQDLTLVSKSGKLIMKGTLTPNNLIKLHFRYTKSNTKNATHKAETSNLVGQQQLKP